MKQDKTGSIIVTGVGESLQRPDGVPEEQWGLPECVDWREKAFELAAKIDVLEGDAEKLRAEIDELQRRLNAFEGRVTPRLSEVYRKFLTLLTLLAKRLSRLPTDAKRAVRDIKSRWKSR